MYVVMEYSRHGLGLGQRLITDLRSTRPQMIDKTVPSLRGCGEVNTEFDSDEARDGDDEYPQDPAKTLAGK